MSDMDVERQDYADNDPPRRALTVAVGLMTLVIVVCLLARLHLWARNELGPP